MSDEGPPEIPGFPGASLAGIQIQIFFSNSNKFIAPYVIYNISDEVYNKLKCR